MDYYFKLYNKKYLKISSCVKEIEYLTDLFANIIGATKDKPDDDLIILHNEIYPVNYYDEISPEYIDYKYYARKTSYKFLFSNDYSKAISFINPIKEFDKSINYLAVNNIHLGMQLQIIQSFKASPCHCALVELNGKGAVIGAVGNTGKSTCATRLPAPHKALCDDYAMLYWENDKIFAQAMPTFSNFMNGDLDYRADCSQTTEISAFFFLKQSERDYTERVNGSTAIQHLNNNFQDLLTIKLLREYPDNALEKVRLKIFDLAFETIKNKPTYMLHASLTGNFWDKIIDVI